MESMTIQKEAIHCTQLQTQFSFLKHNSTFSNMILAYGRMKMAMGCVELKKKNVKVKALIMHHPNCAS